MTITESTTLILGYGLGDVNVLTSIDWSQHIYDTVDNELAPRDIVQVIRTSTPRNDPYRDKNNIIIVETNEIKNFLEELVQKFKRVKSIKDHQVNELNTLVSQMTQHDNSLINEFIENEEKRKEFLSTLSNGENNFISAYLSFLSECIDKLWKDAEPYGEFEPYNKILKILLVYYNRF